jgi:hypothetical protein
MQEFLDQLSDCQLLEMDFAQWRFSAVSTADITQYQMM